MNIDLQVKYSADKHPWLCFRHAAILAMKGTPIKTEIGDFNNENYLDATYCGVCASEEFKKRKLHERKI